MDAVTIAQKPQKQSQSLPKIHEHPKLNCHVQLQKACKENVRKDELQEAQQATINTKQVLWILKWGRTWHDDLVKILIGSVELSDIFK